MTPKIEFFNFGPEQKLDQHSCVEFHSDSDGDGFNLPKPQLNPQKYPLGAPKMLIFNIVPEQKLDHQSNEEFHGDYDGDGLKA